MSVKTNVVSSARSTRATDTLRIIVNVVAVVFIKTWVWEKYWRTVCGVGEHGLNNAQRMGERMVNDGQLLINYI